MDRLSRFVGATLVALLVAGCAGTVAPASPSSSAVGVVASSPPTAVASPSVGTSAPAVAPTAAPEIDLTGLTVSGPMKAISEEGVNFAWLPSDAISNERIDAGALIKVHYEDANGSLVPNDLPGGEGGLEFVMPGRALITQFPLKYAGVTVTPVIESVTWFDAPVGAKTRSPEDIGGVTRKDGAGVLTSSQLANENYYAVAVIPLLGYVDQGKWVDLKVAGGPVTIAPSSRGDIKYFSSVAQAAQKWAMAKKGRQVLPFWKFAADQPAFGTP